MIQPFSDTDSPSADLPDATTTLNALTDRLKLPRIGWRPMAERRTIALILTLLLDRVEAAEAREAIHEGRS